MIPSLILDSLIIVAVLALVCWACHRIYRGIIDEPEPETYGDDGGRPPVQGKGPPHPPPGAQPGPARRRNSPPGHLP